MSETHESVLGIDVGGTKMAVSLWDGLRRIDRSAWATLEGPDDNIAKMLSEGRRLLDETGSSLDAVGISGGGPLDPERGVMLSVPNLPGWDNVAIVERIRSELGVPTRLENDANASALAEWKYGAGRGVDDLAYLTCSTGIGAGLILGGRLYRGSSYLAGEIGHQSIVTDGARCGCGRRGCLEAYASGSGIARRLEAKALGGPNGPRTAKDVVILARSGDRECIEFLRSTASYLALGLANLLFTLNPRRIILGTVVVGAGPLILEPLRDELRDLVWPELLDGVEVLPAALGEDLGDWAARAVAGHERP